MNSLNLVKCHCHKPFGGKDCSLDLSKPPNFELDKECCDLRTESCDSVKAFGDSYSTRDPIYVKIELKEVIKYIWFFVIYFGKKKIDNKWITIEELTRATSINENTVWINLKKIKDLILYKNINQQVVNKIADESIALVNIYISYQDSSFGHFKSFKLYDSKCRTCKNGQLSVIAVIFSFEI